MTNGSKEETNGDVTEVILGDTEFLENDVEGLATSMLLVKRRVPMVSSKTRTTCKDNYRVFRVTISYKGEEWSVYKGISRQGGRTRDPSGRIREGHKSESVFRPSSRIPKTQGEKLLRDPFFYNSRKDTRTLTS